VMQYGGKGVPGLEWGEVLPPHWGVRRLKHICEVFPSNVDKKAYEGDTPVLLCNYTDVYYNDRITRELRFMEATATPEQIKRFGLMAGDTIITKDSETADDIAIAAYVPEDLPGVVCGYHLSMVRPGKLASGSFIKWLFGSRSMKASVQVRANGLTRVGLGQYALDNLVVPVPPRAEQVAIAAFLDRETGKIDAMIEEQRRLIQLLKEKRQAVISHVVTKGLDPNAKMKPSGTIWIDDVPRHWSVVPLKHLADSIKAGPFGSALTKDMYVSEGYRVYGQEQVIPGDFTVGDYYIPALKFQELRQYAVATDDLLISCVGTFGKIAVVPDGVEPGIINPRLIRLRPSKAVLPRYLEHVLRSSVTFEQFSAQSRGGTMDVINIETLNGVSVAVPPLHEQSEIVARLDHQLAEADTLIEGVLNAVTLIQERRSALISAAVTGKIDVQQAMTDREAAA
jgi:type I restriction enzyme S subunit